MCQALSCVLGREIEATVPALMMSSFNREHRGNRWLEVSVIGVVAVFFRHVIWVEDVSGRRLTKGVSLGKLINMCMSVWDGLHFLGFRGLSETEDS